MRLCMLTRHSQRRCHPFVLFANTKLRDTVWIVSQSSGEEVRSKKPRTVSFGSSLARPRALWIRRLTKRDALNKDVWQRNQRFDWNSLPVYLVCVRALNSTLSLFVSVYEFLFIPWNSRPRDTSACKRTNSKIVRAINSFSIFQRSDKWNVVTVQRSSHGTGNKDGWC